MAAKIYVFKMKKIIKAAVIAAIAAAAAITGICLAGGSKSAYVPGTYSTDIILHSNPVSVDVTVTKDEIVGIELNNMNETAEVFYPTISSCAAEIAQAVIEQQSTQVEVNPDYEVAGGIVLAAIEKNLEKASKK